MTDIKLDVVDFGKILGIDTPPAYGNQLGFVALSDDHKKRLATVAALELIKSCSTNNDLAFNIEQLSNYRDQILTALGENVQ